MEELTQNQENILEKVKDNNLKQETINLISKSKEKFDGRLKVYSKIMKLHKEGLGDRKITELIGISKNTINTWIYREVKPRYRVFLPNGVDVVKRLKENGLTNVEIGKLLNVSSTQVGRLLSSKKAEYKKKTTLSQDTINYIKTSVNPLEFLNYLWLVKINQKGLENAQKFCEFIKLQDKMSFFGLCRKLGKSYSTLWYWRRGVSVPWLINWLELYLKLGRKPKEGCIWLPLSLDFRIDSSQVIEVPRKIEKWDNIKNVIEKLTSLETDTIISKISKEECFGFGLGMMVGDAGKRAGRRDGLDLQLTTNSTTNLKLGNFFCECLKKLGFRAYRTKNTRWFYRWVSQVSPFFNWVYKVVLGLDEKETTTYNSVKLNWLLDAPQEISRRFLQGIYESDGSVSIRSREITCVTFPNAIFIQSLLQKFGIKSQIAKDKYKKIRITSKENFKKAQKLLFAPEIETKRYQLLDMLVDKYQNK